MMGADMMQISVYFQPWMIDGAVNQFNETNGVATQQALSELGITQEEYSQVVIPFMHELGVI
jgi:hypothetical protein